MGGIVVGVALFGMTAPGPAPDSPQVADGREPGLVEHIAPATADGKPTPASEPSPALPATTTTTTTDRGDRPPPSGTPPALPVRRSFTMVFTGDVLIHAGVRNAAAEHGRSGDRDFDFRPLLDPVRPIIEGADRSVCHLEVTLASDNEGLAGYPRFRAPRELAADLADVGFDACSTASNHSLDYGVGGVTETLEVMDDAGLAFTGTARTSQEAESSRMVDIDGTSVAHLSYSYGFNGLTVPEDQPWTVGTIDADAILDDAARARRRGAALVVVSLHWGNEYQHDPNDQQRRLAPTLLASPDIDLLVGHHAHVVQPIDRIDGEWVVYGLGNLLSNQTGLTRRDELMVIAHVEERPTGGMAVTGLTAVPMFLDPASATVYPSGPSLRPDGVTDELATELDRSFQRVTDVLDLGSGADQLQILG